MNAQFDENAVARIVTSFARAGMRQSVLSYDPIPLAAMPEGIKKTLVHTVARFFGIEEDAAFPASGDDYALWANRIHNAFRGAIRSTAVAAVTFVTSGSTGRPCPHSFTLGELAEEATALRPFFADRTRVVSVMPVHHVYGFAFALMLPQLLRVPVLEMPPLPSSDFFQGLREGDMIVGFPVFWKALLDMCSGRFALSCPANLHGVTSGAPCPPETIEGLLALAGDAGRPLLGGMTEIYGATEFGAVGLRRQCRGQYALLPHWRRMRLPSEENGENAWGIGRQSGPAFPLPDEIMWQAERNFLPLWRKDRAVQVGGLNVFPARIADILRCHPGVRDCAIRMMRPEEGSRLKAFIVPAQGAASGEAVSEHALARELRQWLAARLDSPSMPKAFSFGPALPLSPSGKLADWNIAGRIQPDSME